MSGKEGSVRLLFIILMIFWSVNAFSAIYKWVDAGGSVHYSDKKGVTSQVTKIEAVPSPSEGEAGLAQERINKLKQQLEDSKKQEKQRLEIEKEKQAKLAERKKQCLELLNTLEHIKYARGVYYKDENGNKVFYDEKTRQQRTDQYQDAYNKNCI